MFSFIIINSLKSTVKAYNFMGTKFHGLKTGTYLWTVEFVDCKLYAKLPNC